MQVFIEKSNQERQLKFRGSASSLLKKLKINSEEVLVVKNGSLVSEDEKLSDSDSIRILSVISGG